MNSRWVLCADRLPPIGLVVTCRSIDGRMFSAVVSEYRPLLRTFPFDKYGEIKTDWFMLKPSGEKWQPHQWLEEELPNE